MTESDGWFVRFCPRPDPELRLFCFPYAGGGASVFRRWALELPERIELWAMQAPGRESRISESPLDRLASLVERLETAIVTHLDRPAVFYGHSLGGLVAFELARALQRGHRAPARLMVSASKAPHLPLRLPVIHQLPTALFLHELRRYNGTPAGVLETEELRELLLPGLRADFALFETHRYVPGEALACPITAFGGRADENVLEPELERWRELTSGAFRLRMFAGDHFFTGSPLFPAALVAELAPELALELAPPSGRQSGR